MGTASIVLSFRSKSAKGAFINRVKLAASEILAETETAIRIAATFSHYAAANSDLVYSFSPAK